MRCYGPKKFYVDDEQGVCAFKFVAVTCLAQVMEHAAKLFSLQGFIDAQVGDPPLIVHTLA